MPDKKEISQKVKKTILGVQMSGKWSQFDESFTKSFKVGVSKKKVLFWMNLWLKKSERE